MQYRSGETEQTRFRANRFFNSGEDVYFLTREGHDIGPFPSLTAAQRGLSLYLQCMEKETHSGTYATKIAMQGLWASTHYS